MKIASNKFSSFIKNIPSNINAILIYGPDNGQISLKSKELTQQFLQGDNVSFRKFDLAFSSIKDEPEKLADTLYAMSFSGKSSLVTIYDLATSLPKAFCEVLEYNKTKNLAVLIADELPPSSSLRKYFETAKHTAIVPCYIEDAGNIKASITQSLTKDGFEFEPEILELLAQNLAGDMLLVNSEIEKLKTYCYDSKFISYDDAFLLCSDQSGSSLDEFCSFFASKKLAESSKLLQKLVDEKTATVTILRALLRYFTRMHYVKNLANTGMSLSAAVEQLKPPVFFKQKPLFIQQVNNWDLKAINKILQDLLEYELQAKKSVVVSEALCDHLLLSTLS